MLPERKKLTLTVRELLQWPLLQLPLSAIQVPALVVSGVKRVFVKEEINIRKYLSIARV